MSVDWISAAIATSAAFVASGVAVLLAGNPFPNELETRYNRVMKRVLTEFLTELKSRSSEIRETVEASELGHLIQGVQQLGLKAAVYDEWASYEATRRRLIRRVGAYLMGFGVASGLLLGAFVLPADSETLALIVGVISFYAASVLGVTLYNLVREFLSIEDRIADKDRTPSGQPIIVDADLKRARNRIGR